MFQNPKHIKMFKYTKALYKAWSVNGSDLVLERYFIPSSSPLTWAIPEATLKTSKALFGRGSKFVSYFPLWYMEIHSHSQLWNNELWLNGELLLMSNIELKLSGIIFVYHLRVFFFWILWSSKISKVVCFFMRAAIISVVFQVVRFTSWSSSSNWADWPTGFDPLG